MVRPLDRRCCGGSGLRAGGRVEPRTGRRRHQVVSVPRPVRPARAGSQPVGRRPGAGHRHPSDHRLPVADGAVLLAPRHGGLPRLAGPAAVAGHAGGCGRARGALPAAHPGLAGPRAAGRDAGVPAEPVSAALLGPHLRGAAAVGRAGLDDRPHREVGPLRGLAVSGPVRVDGAHGGQRQRHQSGAGRAGPGAVAVARRAGGAQHHRRPGRGDRGPDRRARRGGVAVVGSRAAGAGRLQPARHPLHRDLRGGGGRQHRAGDPARPRLLVLLRQRQVRPVDRAQRRVHPGPLAGVPGLRPGGRRGGAGRGGAVAAPRLLPAAAGGRGAGRGGRPSLRQPVCGGRAVQGGGGQRHRPSPALHAPGRAAGGAVGSGAGRRGRQRAAPSSAPLRRLRRRRGAGRGGARQPGHVAGPHGRGALAAARSLARVLDGSG